MGVMAVRTRTAARLVATLLATLLAGCAGPAADVPGDTVSAGPSGVPGASSAGSASSTDAGSTGSTGTAPAGPAGVTATGPASAQGPACGAEAPPEAAPTSSAAASADSHTTLTVLAAASLRGVFTTIAHQFEADHPGVAVRLSFDGSAALAAQVRAGTPADVLATADVGTLATLTCEGRFAGNPSIFATNSLVLAVPAANPARVARLSDLAVPGVATLRCADLVPCGEAARRVEAAAGLSLAPVSLEQSVAAVATKLAAGEADAGFVYATDVLASDGALTAVPLPAGEAMAQAALTTYAVSVPVAAPHAEVARQFVDAVLGAAGQAALRAAGFGPAPTA